MARSALELSRAARDGGLLAGWDKVPGLGAILAAGPDARSFLQARLTSDVNALDPGQGQLAAKLTGKGELIAYFSLHRLPDRGQPFPSYLLLLESRSLPLLLADLVSTVISEDVLLEDASAEFAGVMLHGPQAAVVAAAACGLDAAPGLPEYGVTARGDEGLDDFPAGAILVSRSFTGDPGRLMLWPRGQVDPKLIGNVHAAATAAGFVDFNVEPAAAEAWRWLMLEAGWPRPDTDFVPGRTLLPRTGLEQQVVSSVKGCYPGQEVVARIRTYGSVPAALRGLVFEALAVDDLAGFPAPGEALLEAGGTKAGAWASSGFSAVWGAPIALAYLDRKHRTPGTRLALTVDGVPAEALVILLPFFQATDATERARHLHDRAVNLFSGGKDAEAIALLEEALRLDPARKDAFEALGVILGRTERFHEAIAIFRRLEEVAPEEPMVHTNLSLFYMKIGDTVEAENQKAMATMKRFAGLGDPAELGKMEAAEKDARRQDAQRKQTMFGEVLELDPDDPLALMGYGQACAALEDHAAAAVHLGRALDQQQDNSAVYAALGRALEALGRLEEAADVYHRGVAVASRRGDLMPLKDMEHRLLLLSG